MKNYRNNDVNFRNLDSTANMEADAMQNHARKNFSLSSLFFYTGYLLRSVAVLILVALLAVGVWYLIRSFGDKPAPVAEVVVKSQVIKKAPEPTIDWSKVDEELRVALVSARKKARGYAAGELGKWTDGMRGRIDEAFLPWYFGYWNQKKMAFDKFRYEVADTKLSERLFSKQPSAAERMTEDIQREFANQVLRPPIAQREIEKIAAGTAQIYITELHKHLNHIQSTYKIPQPEWNKYLDDLSELTAVGGPDTIPFSLKAVYTVGTGAVVFTGAKIAEIIGQALGKVSTKMIAGKVAAGTTKAVVGKASIKAATKIGSKFMGPLALVAVTVWDVVDHNNNVNKSKPVLRRNLDDYLKLLQEQLLDDSECGMMMFIHEFEKRINEDLAKPERLPVSS